MSVFLDLLTCTMVTNLSLHHKPLLGCRLGRTAVGNPALHIQRLLCCQVGASVADLSLWQAADANEPIAGKFRFCFLSAVADCTAGPS